MDSPNHITIETHNLNKTYKGVQAVPTISPIIGTIVLTIAFIATAVWRFARQEF
jgi:lipopolysaccharide export LptBFGC system permease protein LptF